MHVLDTNLARLRWDVSFPGELHLGSRQVHFGQYFAK